MSLRACRRVVLFGSVGWRAGGGGVPEGPVAGVPEGPMAGVPLGKIWYEGRRLVRLVLFGSTSAACVLLVLFGSMECVW